MKKIIYKGAVLLGLLSTMPSCTEDFIDRLPLDEQMSSNFYKTEEDGYKALVAVYDVLGYEATPGISWAPFLTVSDMLSDDSYAGGQDSNDGMEEDELNMYNISTTNPIVHAIWVKNYVGIYRANLLLEKIEGIDASADFKKRVTAECKFLRAYFYFEQVSFFENIPLLTKTIKSESDYDQPQASVDNVYTQIFTDLLDASTNLPAVIPADEGGRISQWAAKSLLGRVYLFYNGVYGKELSVGSTNINKAYVLTALEDVVDNSGHDLFPDYTTNFKIAGEFGIESVFEIAHGDIPVWWDWNYARGGEGNLAAQMQGPRVSLSKKWDRGWSFATVSQKLVNDMAGDPRQDMTILFEEELDGKLDKGYQHTGYFSQKYSSDAEHWGSGGQFELNRTANFRVIRFSDVLLMAAELGSGRKQDFLNRVRGRVKADTIPATDENIYKERRLELSLEGVRYFDVLRKGLDYAEKEFTVKDLRGPKYLGDQQLFNHTFNKKTKGFLPIPRAEVDLSNGNFKQNEGY